MTDQVPAVVETPVIEAKGETVSIETFAFGDAESVLDRREMLGAIESWHNGRYYEPPIPLRNLARVLNISSHHRSAIEVKRNLLVGAFEPTPYLNRTEFGKLAMDFLVMGNCYPEAVMNRLGKVMYLKASLAIATRRGVKDGQFWFIDSRWKEHEFAPDTVFQLMEHDVSQEIYGLPGYLSALQSALLNEASTLFRRRYYLNGSHAGYVFYVSDATIGNGDVDAIRKAMREAKGPGNFRNMFVHAPGGKEKGIQILPVGEAAAKDEFLGIKNTTRDDILAAHRVPPQLLGVVPANTGGFGDVEKAEAVFMRIEIEPLKMRFLEINDWLGAEAVKFKPYVPPAAAAAA